jgi:hypothetical protein
MKKIIRPSFLGLGFGVFFLLGLPVMSLLRLFGAVEPAFAGGASTVKAEAIRARILSAIDDVRAWRPAFGPRRDHVAHKVVVGKFSDFRFQNNVRSSFPRPAHAFLSNGKTLSNHVKYVPRPAGLYPMCGQVNGDHAFRAHIAQWHGRNGVGKKAVH